MTGYVAGFMVNPSGTIQTTAAGIFGNISVTGTFTITGVPVAGN
jgi:hypothetical protein